MNARGNRNYALVVPGLMMGGGVPRVAAYFQRLATETGFNVQLFDLAVSYRDPESQRILAPRSWTAGNQMVWVDGESGYWKVGASLAELELMRYRAQMNLTRFLNEFAIVQLVSGTPAWACIGRGVKVPMFHQVATLARWERPSRLVDQTCSRKVYGRVNLRLISKRDQQGARLATHVFVENRQMQRWYEEHAPDTPVSRLLPGIDLLRFSPPETGWCRNGALISVGRLDEPRKGWRDLIYCYHHLLRTYYSAPPLKIVGSGQISETVQDLITRLGLREKVQIVANVSDTQLADHLRRASAYVTTSHEEGLGLATMEALACGLPVVATSTDGSRELLEGQKCGVLIGQPDGQLAQRFTSAVAAILTTHGDSMSREARRCATVRFDERIAKHAVLQAYSRYVHIP